MKLSDLADFNPPTVLKRGDTAPFIEMAALPVDARDISQISEREFKGSGSRFKDGDTLFARITPCLENGKGGRITHLGAGISGHGSTEFIVLRAKSDADSLFVYYLTRFDEFRAFAEKHMSGTSGRQRVSWQSLAEYEVPSLTENARRNLAAVLGVLDDKIALNRRMNATLEAMARALFRDWFVDFGPTRAKQAGESPYLAPELWSLFPDHLDDEGRPEGWARAPLGDLVNVSIGRTPPRKEREHFLSGQKGIPWLSIKTMGDLQTFAFDTEESLTEYAVNTYRVPVVPAGTVLLSFKLTVGRVAIASRPMATNEAIAHLYENFEKTISSEFLYCAMKEFDFDRMGSTSSIARAINSKMVREIPLVLPGPSLLEEFAKEVAPLFLRIQLATEESRTLAQTRDLLLPRLMSGELRVAEAEKLAGEVL